MNGKCTLFEAPLAGLMPHDIENAALVAVLPRAPAGTRQLAFDLLPPCTATVLQVK